MISSILRSGLYIDLNKSYRDKYFSPPSLAANKWLGNKYLPCVCRAFFIHKGKTSVPGTLLAKQVKYFKETEGGREIVCKTFEDLAEKRIIEDRKITAKMLLEKGNMSIEEIAAISRLSVEEVEKLADLQPV